jgi:hypothetical protein
MATRSAVTTVTAVTDNRGIPLPECPVNVRGRHHHFCATRPEGIAEKPVTAVTVVTLTRDPRSVTSPLSRLNGWIELAQLYASIGWRETPVHAGRKSVAFFVPSFYFSLQLLDGAKPSSLEALCLTNTEISTSTMFNHEPCTGV